MIIRLHGDEQGESHLTRLDLPSGVLRDIATTSMSIHDTTERAPSHGYQPASQRQLVVVLRGTMMIGASDGTVERLGPGDALWEEDQGSKGHSLEDVGDEPMMVVIVGIPVDYELPVAP
jgi:quercetin dioxygenase-like cupin family protein